MEPNIAMPFTSKMSLFIRQGNKNGIIRILLMKIKSTYSNALSMWHSFVRGWLIKYIMTAYSGVKHLFETKLCKKKKEMKGSTIL